MERRKKEYIFGIHAVTEALEAGVEIEKVFIKKGAPNPAIQKLSSEINKLRIPLLKVPEEKLNKITRKNHQGIIAMVSSISYASLDHIISETYRKGEDPLLLVLDRITDVRNFGAIARTAEGLGFHGIIVPARGGALINEEAMKTSAGALAHIAVSRVKSLESTLQYLKNNGIFVLACTEKAGTSLYNKKLTGPLALVLGSEYDGISDNLLDLCNDTGFIPMFGRIESFNVSVSMAIAGSEIVRQRTS